MRNNNFQCDLDSKKRVMEAMRYAYRPNMFIFEIEENPTAPIDCRAIGITQNGKTIHYAIEIKHRNFTADKYDSFYCEPSKYQSLLFETLTSGIDRAYIANEFSDGTILLWNIKDLDPNDTEDVMIARTTVGIGDFLSQKIKQKRILMKRDKAIKIR